MCRQKEKNIVALSVASPLSSPIERNKKKAKSIQIKRILDFSISVGDETVGENICGYKLLILSKNRGITISVLFNN